MKLPKSRRTFTLKSPPWVGVRIDIYWSLGMYVCEAIFCPNGTSIWSNTVAHPTSRTKLIRRMRVALEERRNPAMEKVRNRVFKATDDTAEEEYLYKMGRSSGSRPIYE